MGYFGFTDHNLLHHLLHALQCSAMQCMQQIGELKPQQHVSRKGERLFPLFFCLLLLNRQRDGRRWKGPAAGPGSLFFFVMCGVFTAVLRAC